MPVVASMVPQPMTLVHSLGDVRVCETEEGEYLPIAVSTDVTRTTPRASKKTVPDPTETAC